DYMKICLKLSKIALEAGDPPVGALLVVHDKIIGEGVESGRSTNDITNHAEMLAVKNAIELGNQRFLPEATMYTTHEPCLMCSYAIRHYKIPKIVYGTSVEHIGGHTSEFDILSTQNVPKWTRPPQIIGGICKEECDQLTAEFVRRISSH
ncbi:MAG: nucleoside deaminase, partial [Bacteroidota bacterium]